MEELIKKHLYELCRRIPNRHVGSPGNREATDYFAHHMRLCGFQAVQQEFDCLDWEPGEAFIRIGGVTLPANPSPYTLPYSGSAPLVAASTLAGLSALDAAGRILLIHGELAREQLIPKNFPFFIPASFPGLAALLEAKAPAAIIAATGRNPELAGAAYPFPLIEDGDFSIPSVYITDIEGEKLLGACGSDAHLSVGSLRIPSTGCNVRGMKGSPDRPRLVFCAHIDAKKGTPGALDNASGVCVLLALAKLLEGYEGNLCVELLALNGEDYYSAPGQSLYLALPGDELDRIVLAVNMDLVGYREGRTGISFYGCPEGLADSARKAVLRHDGMFEGPVWYQGDHMVFVSRGRPAMALVSESIAHLCSEITHTERDVPELVDCGVLAGAARALRDLVPALSR